MPGVESALNQTYANMEVIVVNDGSTDGTLAELAARYGNKVRVIVQANAGPSAARNRGITASRGDLVAFLDSDDLWLPTKIGRQVTLLQRLGNSAPCCLGNILMRWNDRERTSFDISWLTPPFEEGVWLNVDEVMATRFVLFNQGVMIRRDVIKRIGGFNERLRLLEDHELALRLSLEGPWAFVREPLIVWRESEHSLSRGAGKHELTSGEAMVRILETHLSTVTKRGSSVELQKRVDRELKWARRRVAVSKMSGADSWGMSAVGRALQWVERYRAAAVRRSAAFPKMRAQELAC